MVEEAPEQRDVVEHPEVVFGVEVPVEAGHEVQDVQVDHLQVGVALLGAALQRGGGAHVPVAHGAADQQQPLAFPRVFSHRRGAPWRAGRKWPPPSRRPGGAATAEGGLEEPVADVHRMQVEADQPGLPPSADAAVEGGDGAVDPDHPPVEVDRERPRPLAAAAMQPPQRGGVGEPGLRHRLAAAGALQPLRGDEAFRLEPESLPEFPQPLREGGPRPAVAVAEELGVAVVEAMQADLRPLAPLGEDESDEPRVLGDVMAAAMAGDDQLRPGGYPHRVQPACYGFDLRPEIWRDVMHRDGDFLHFQHGLLLILLPP